MKKFHYHLNTIVHANCILGHLRFNMARCEVAKGTNLKRREKKVLEDQYF